MSKLAKLLKKQMIWPIGLAGLGLFVAGSALWAQVPDAQSGAPMVTLPGQVIAPPPPGATDTPRNAHSPYGESPFGDTGVIEEPSAGSHPDDGPVELPANQPNWQAPSPAPSAQLPENSSQEYGNAQAVSPQSSAGADLADFGRQNPNGEIGGEIGGDRVSQADRLERPLPPAKLQPLLALANNLGALHAVRIRCGSHDDQTYRTRMAAILAIEAPIGTQRRRTLVERFNNGFATHGQGQGSCDPATNRMEETLARSGEILARQLAAAYRPTPPPTPPAPAAAPANGAQRANGPNPLARSLANPRPPAPQTNAQRATTPRH